MSDNSAIEWTDATWNPVTGCTEVSPGCDHCYAKTFAERWRGTPGHYFEHGFDVQLRPGKLTLPLSWKKPRRVFVNSMSDLFHQDVPDEYIARVFAVMAATPRHTYQVLTKRHGRMRSLLRNDEFRVLTKLMHAEMQLAKTLPYQPLVINVWPLRNVWLGVSVEDQKWADIRIPALLMTPAAVRFLSCEPLLGRVDLTKVSYTDGGGTHLDVVNGRHGVPDLWTAPGKRVDWVIVGGESGHGARPMHPDWARQLRVACTEAGVPFHYKQWGQWAPAWGRPVDGDRWVMPDGGSEPWRHGHRHWRSGGGDIEGSGDAVLMRRAAKAQTGRALDGRTWDEFPMSAVERAEIDREIREDRTRDAAGVE